MAALPGLDFTSKTHSDTYAEINPAVDPAPCAGRTVLVTGAAKGIGRAIVCSYARAGTARIVVTTRTGDASETLAAARQAAAEAGRSNVELISLRLDVNDRASVEACAAELQSRGARGEWAQVDVLVNNAGYMASFAPLADGDADDWWMTYEVNVRGIYWTTRAFLPLVLASELKIIVNTTSIGALLATPGASAYQTSKLAVLRLADHLMAEYGSQGLLVYSVHPGAIVTDLARRMGPELLRTVCNDKPELAGDSYVYLTSKRCEWLAGRYISLTWDLPELMAREEEIVERNLLKVQVAFS
ncbi:hypothetical protein C7999DRAFT_17570 [Corynascus novoguineensis]|uniref:Uncharacterized protein n=1 Tax=Corynascus novoguineensis TaxID=1126955 RepID=A0AAN7CLV7_9PEZI|nr:hypothetical protein C7999DRAFT_17570 [Corynascus novoguineensis]